MAKLDFVSRTLDDEIVKDGLCAVGALEDFPMSRGMTFVVGGVATQSYLPSVFRRETTDIDLAVRRALSFTDFRDFSKAAAEYLRDNGYLVEQKKGHLSHQLLYTGENGTCVIEFPRRNQKNYEQRAIRLDRENEHTRRKIVEGRTETYKVASPEDIAVPKIVRGVGSLSRHPEFCGYVESVSPVAMTDEDIEDDKSKIACLREEALVSPNNPALAERLRFVSDIFDIRALSEAVGFNDAYLHRVMGSWDVLKERSAETNLLVNYLLPEMSNN